MREMGLFTISAGQAARRLAKRRASEILGKGKDPLASAREFGNLWIRAGYPREIQSIGNLEDDMDIAEITGQSEDEIRKWVVERLKAIIRQPNSIG